MSYSRLSPSVSRLSCTKMFLGLAAIAPLSPPCSLSPWLYEAVCITFLLGSHGRQKREVFFGGVTECDLREHRDGCMEGGSLEEGGRDRSQLSARLCFSLLRYCLATAASKTLTINQCHTHAHTPKINSFQTLKRSRAKKDLSRWRIRGWMGWVDRLWKGGGAGIL